VKKKAWFESAPIFGVSRNLKEERSDALLGSSFRRPNT
jgi:hypothetical protein